MAAQTDIPHNTENFITLEKWTENDDIVKFVLLADDLQPIATWWYDRTELGNYLLKAKFSIWRSLRLYKCVNDQGFGGGPSKQFVYKLYPVNTFISSHGV